jgi:hypothetical protein
MTKSWKLHDFFWICRSSALRELLDLRNSRLNEGYWRLVSDIATGFEGKKPSTAIKGCPQGVLWTPVMTRAGIVVLDDNRYLSSALTLRPPPPPFPHHIQTDRERAGGATNSHNADFLRQ